MTSETVGLQPEQNPLRAGQPSGRLPQSAEQPDYTLPSSEVSGEPVVRLRAEPPVQALRRQVLLLSVACAVATLPCLLLWRSTHALASELDMRQARTAGLVADSQAIMALRQRPREVSETGLPRSDLLGRVNRAMRSAGLAPDTLASTLPQPPRARPGSERAEVVNRLLFEGVRLEPLVRFCHALTENSPELRISGIQLRAEGDRERWDADVSVSYWIVTPARGG